MASYPRTFRASLFLLAIVGMGLVISGFGTRHFFTRNGLSVDIVRVVGEKGVPVALELQTGGWVKLPSLGAGPHPNTVRAWLRKEAPSDAGATIP